MANIERAIKAAIAKRGLEFSLKDEKLYLGGMIQGHSVLHYTMMMAATPNLYHWIDLRTLCVYDKKIQAFSNYIL